MTNSKRKIISKEYANVKVLAWDWSHNTENGNGVYKFTVLTPDGEHITGKTKPNAGFRQSVGSSPSVFARCVIDETPSGRVQMSHAEV